MTFILILLKLQMKLELTVQNIMTHSFMTHGVELMAYLAVITLPKQWNLSHKVQLVMVRHNFLLMLFPLLRNTQTLMK
ncbi:hypothetical protein AYI71_01615 [Limosilactobacillus oris]|nr:hypothetical protein AYI71_01615 [Limosilactobacillus oris]